MSHAQLEALVNTAFEDRATISAATTGDVRDAVNQALLLLDSGQLRVAEKLPGKTGVESWKTSQWLKKAVLLSFRLQDNEVVRDGYTNYFDKVPAKFADYGSADFRAGGFQIGRASCRERVCYPV